MGRLLEAGKTTSVCLDAAYNSYMHPHVFLASDHGNVECTGIGRPSEGITADVRGERVRVYRNAELRSRIKLQFPKTVDWLGIGLPDDYLPLIANGRYGFISTGEALVAHGGILLDEVVVPFVEIRRRMQ